MMSLDQAIRSCSQYVAEAENGMINGSIQRVRLAFTKAEEALEDAQHFRAEVENGALPASTAQAIDDLGNRLDALWVRLICAFS
jgi:hypothetical protein